MSDRRVIKVFIASPGDLAVERRKFKEVIDELNRGFGRGANVEFVGLGWEDALATTGRRPQDVINQDVDDCEVFILALHGRWGQMVRGTSPYSSYTEEEFHRAYDRFKTSSLPHIHVFFKHISPREMSDPGPELQKVLAFRRQLEDTDEVLYRLFSDESDFASEIDRHLVAYINGNIQIPSSKGGPLLPAVAIEEIDKARAEALLERERAERAEAEAALQRDRADAATLALASEAHARAAQLLQEAQENETELEIARQAARAATLGRVEQARQDLAKVLAKSTNLSVLFFGVKFYMQVSEYDEAERLLHRWLAISGPQKETRQTAGAYGNLGVIYGIRKELDKADEMHSKTLAISKANDDLAGMASSYGNLGLIMKLRGENEAAERLYLQALAIDERLGREAEMAITYSNLGVIYKNQGDLQKAEWNVLQSLRLSLKHSIVDGIARAYANLAVIYLNNRDFEAARESIDHSISINKHLGYQEGLAIAYNNLGTLEEMAGNKSEAVTNWYLAQEIYRKIGLHKNADAVQKIIDDLLNS